MWMLTRDPECVIFGCRLNIKCFYLKGDNDVLRRSPGTPVFTAPECCLGQDSSHCIISNLVLFSNNTLISSKSTAQKKTWFSLSWILVHRLRSEMKVWLLIWDGVSEVWTRIFTTLTRDFVQVTGLTYHGKLADTWAAGVTLYCMVLGNYPFLGDTLQDTYDKVLGLLVLIFF